VGEAVDLSKLGRDELLQLSRGVDEALKSFQKRRREEALREMDLVARKHGLALRNLVQGSAKGSVQIPKYKHPENPALTWSGRGRQPIWFKQAIEAGHSRDDFLIV
jgi:DNA-binding protein H-NS